MASLKTLAIAIGAGLASALLFAASAKGGALALAIMAATPLPVMIATLGFAQSTGLIAATVATLVNAALMGPLHGVVFGLLFAFSAWWLCYLSLLARPADDPASIKPALAWYPIGRAVTWGALLVSAILLAMGAATLWHYGGFTRAVTALTGIVESRISASEAERSLASQAGLVVRLMPSLVAGITFAILSFNLWIAARVVQGSNLLSRPWPSLPEHLRLPRFAALLFIGASLLVLLGGVVGVACGTVVAPLCVAFMFQGLATAHALTRGFAARRMILIVVYFLTLSLTPSLLALAVLGLVDCLLPLRRPRAVSPSPSP